MDNPKDSKDLSFTLSQILGTYKAKNGASCNHDTPTPEIQRNNEDKHMISEQQRKIEDERSMMLKKILLGDNLSINKETANFHSEPSTFPSMKPIANPFPLSPMQQQDTSSYTRFLNNNQIHYNSPIESMNNDRGSMFNFGVQQQQQQQQPIPNQYYRPSYYNANPITYKQDNNSSINDYIRPMVPTSPSHSQSPSPFMNINMLFRPNQPGVPTQVPTQVPPQYYPMFQMRSPQRPIPRMATSSPNQIPFPFVPPNVPTAGPQTVPTTQQQSPHGDGLLSTPSTPREQRHDDVMKNIHNATEYEEVLTQQAWQFYYKNALSVGEMDMRYYICKKIEAWIRHDVYEGRAHLFGSSINGFGSKDSDMDITFCANLEGIVLPDEIIKSDGCTPAPAPENGNITVTNTNVNGSGSAPTPVSSAPAPISSAPAPVGSAPGSAPASSAPGSAPDGSASPPKRSRASSRARLHMTPQELEHEKEVILVQRIERCLRKLEQQNIVKDVCVTLSSKVPVIKFIDNASNLHVDITINNYLPLFNSLMLRTYCSLDSRVGPLGFIIKYWAKQRDINDPTRRTLSSYGYVLMALFFLMTRDPVVIPCLQQLTDIKDLYDMNKLHHPVPEPVRDQKSEDKELDDMILNDVANDTNVNINLNHIISSPSHDHDHTNSNANNASGTGSGPVSGPSLGTGLGATPGPTPMNDDLFDDDEVEEIPVDGAWITAKGCRYNVYFASLSNAISITLNDTVSFCNGILTDSSLVPGGEPGSGLKSVPVDSFRSYNTFSLGALVRQFFRYYAYYLSFDDCVLSIRKGVTMTKSEKKWGRAYYFCIEDPFVLSHNIMRVLDRKMQRLTHNELMRAFKMLWPISKGKTRGPLHWSGFFDEVCESTHQGYEVGLMAKLRGMDWLCESCHTTNVATENVCAYCGTVKDKEKEKDKIIITEDSEGEKEGEVGPAPTPTGAVCINQEKKKGGEKTEEEEKKENVKEEEVKEKRKEEEKKGEKAEEEKKAKEEEKKIKDEEKKATEEEKKTSEEKKIETVVSTETVKPKYRTTVTTYKTTKMTSYSFSN